LEKEIENLEKQISENHQTIDEQILIELSNKKSDLENIRKVKLEGVMLRSKCRYEDMGEKTSKYFLNLEKRNYISKTINKLIDDNNIEYSDVNDILSYQKTYYANLYKDTLIIDDIPLSNILGINPIQLNESEILSLEGEITIEELNVSIKGMKDEKALD
jgi:hypothetical protein